MKSYKRRAGLILCSALVIAAVVGTSMLLHNKPNEPAQVTAIPLDLVFNPNSMEELIGSSENVFLGRVVSQTGDQALNPDMPRTQFKVQVLHNIKGKLPDAVVVNQLMGYCYQNDENSREIQTLVKYEGQAFLEPGKTYMFSGLFAEKDQWINLTPVYGEKLVPADGEKEAVETYEKAFSQQVIPVAYGNKENPEAFINGYIYEIKANGN